MEWLSSSQSLCEIHLLMRILRTNWPFLQFTLQCDSDQSDDIIMELNGGCIHQGIDSTEEKDFPCTQIFLWIKYLAVTLMETYFSNNIILSLSVRHKCAYHQTRRFWASLTIILTVFRVQSWFIGLSDARYSNLELQSWCRFSIPSSSIDTSKCSRFSVFMGIESRKDICMYGKFTENFTGFLGAMFSYPLSYTSKFVTTSAQALGSHLPLDHFLSRLLIMLQYTYINSLLTFNLFTFHTNILLSWSHYTHSLLWKFNAYLTPPYNAENFASVTKHEKNDNEQKKHNSPESPQRLIISCHPAHMRITSALTFYLRSIANTKQILPVKLNPWRLLAYVQLGSLHSWECWPKGSLSISSFWTQNKAGRVPYRVLSSGNNKRGRKDMV